MTNNLSFNPFYLLLFFNTGQDLNELRVVTVLSIGQQLDRSLTSLSLSVILSYSMTFGNMMIMPGRKFVRVQEKGQVTIPTELRKKLSLKKGDLVTVTETPEGVLITPQEVLAMKALDRIGEALKEKGLSLEELIKSGRDIRGKIVEENYGVKSPKKA